AAADLGRRLPAGRTQHEVRGGPGVRRSGTAGAAACRAAGGVGVMNAAVKYTLGRVLLFIACLAALVPVPLNLWVKLMIAVVASFGLQFVLLRKWRQEMIGEVDQAVARRRQEKRRLRTALAGDGADEPSG